MPKNIEFFFIFFELIDALFINIFLFNKFVLKFSFKIFVLRDLDKLIFFILIAFKISYLSEKIFLFLYS